MNTMKCSSAALLVVLLALTGCARNYVMTLSNGSHVVTDGKPKLVNGYYVGKDPSGRPVEVSAGRVREVSPASMVEDEKQMFKPKTR